MKIYFIFMRLFSYYTCAIKSYGDWVEGYIYRAMLSILLFFIFILIPIKISYLTLLNNGFKFLAFMSAIFGIVIFIIIYPFLHVSWKKNSKY